MAINILSIGNSFSQDAHRYIHYLSKSEGEDIQTTNLWIGGCSLERHFRNMMGDSKVYDLTVNGNPTDFKMPMSEGLLAKSWDYVSLQQNSPGSFIYENYVPYINEIAEFVRELCPKAKILIHQTWGYETGSEKIKGVGFKTYDEMFAKVKKCCDMAAEEIGADGILPFGEVFASALKNGIGTVHRDTFHASYGVGRFMLALTWYKYVTGNSIDNVKFNDFDVPVSDEEYKIAIKSVNDVL